MNGGLPINAGVFIQKSLEGSCRDGARMPASAFPVLKGTEFGGEATRDQDIHGLNLAQVICFPPSLETEDDRSRSPPAAGMSALAEKGISRARQP